MKTNALNFAPPFTIADGSYTEPSNSIEKVTYSSVSNDLKNELSDVRTSGYLTCALPLSLSKSSSGSLRVGIAINDEVPNFDGTEGTDFVVFKSAASTFSVSGVTISLPLSVITAQGLRVSSLSIHVKNMSGGNASVVSSYASIATVSIIPDMTLSDVPTPPIPSNLVISSYLDCTASGSLSSINFSDVVNAGYRGPIIFGFGWVGPSSYSGYESKTCQEAYIPDVEGYYFKTGLIAKVSEAKLAGFDKCFLSFGGSAQSFLCGKSGFSPVVTLSDVQTLAQNMVNLALDVGCNGIDFDFEMGPNDTAGYLPQTGIYSYNYGGQGIVPTQNFISLLAQLIKQYGETTSGEIFYVACAPQVNQTGNSPTPIASTAIFVSNGSYNIFDLAISNGCFDYVFIQFYNTFPQANPTWAKSCWSKLASILQPGDTNTKLIAGYPATAGSAGDASIFHYDSSNPNVANPSITLTTSVGTLNLTSTLQEMQADPESYKNFGGVFNWSLNRDFYNFDEVPTPWTTPGEWGRTMLQILGE